MKVKIYTLLDFSPYSEALLKICNEWYGVFKFEVIAIHEVAFSTPALSSKTARLQIGNSEKNEALEKLKKYCKTYLNENIIVTYQITDNSISNFLNESISPYKENIVLVGLKGSNYLKEFFIGSTAKDVINNVNETIIACPKENNDIKPQKFIFSIDSNVKINLIKLKEFVNRFAGITKQIEFVSFCKDDLETSKFQNVRKDIEAIVSNDFTFSQKNFNNLDQLKDYTLSEKKSMLIFQKGSRSTFDALFRKFFISNFIDDASSSIVIIS